MIDNVKFAIVVPTYSTAHKRLVMGTDPVVENVPGKFVPQQLTLESEITQGTEKDRVIRFRLIFQRTQQLETLVKSGAIIVITHKRHRLTNSWALLDAPEQYIVNTDVNVHDVGDEINLGLVSKDQQ